jgi:hypothetical protein
MKPSIRCLIVAAAVGVASCGSNKVSDVCKSVEREWTFSDPQYSIDGLKLNVIDVSGGVLRWNDRPASIRQIDHYMALVARMGEEIGIEPHIILRSGPISDCNVLEAVRDLLDKATVCREGRCAEGRSWDRWMAGGPRPGPPSPQVWHGS